MLPGKGSTPDSGNENMEPDVERRNYLRAEIRWPVVVESKRGTIEARLRNLGVGGAYVHCDKTPDPGEIISLIIRPPERSGLMITAEVIWTGKVLALGMGVRFIEISAEDREFISRIVEDHLGGANLD